MLTPADFAPPPAVYSHYVEGRRATVNCIIERANKHGLAANVLLAVWEQESGPHGKAVAHPNGAVDIGEMQWNRATVKQYARFGITEHHLKADGCYAADLAAQRIVYHLSHGRSGQGYWQRVANYHNAKEPFNARYAKLIQQRAAGWDAVLTKHFAKQLVPLSIKKVGGVAAGAKQ